MGIFSELGKNNLEILRAKGASGINNPGGWCCEHLRIG